jgi:hypothetical protein
VFFHWEKVASVLEIFSALEMVKMVFYCRFYLFIYLPLFRCARFKHTNVHHYKQCTIIFFKNSVMVHWYAQGAMMHHYEFLKGKTQ